MLDQQISRRGFMQLLASVAAASGLSYAGVPVSDRILAAAAYDASGETAPLAITADDPLSYFQIVNPVCPKIAIVNAAIESQQITYFSDWDFTGGISSFMETEARSQRTQYETMFDIVFPSALRGPETPFRDDFDLVHRLFLAGEHFDYVLQFSNCRLHFPDSCAISLNVEYSMEHRSPMVSVNLYSFGELSFVEEQ